MRRRFTGLLTALRGFFLGGLGWFGAPLSKPSHWKPPESEPENGISFSFLFDAMGM